MDWIEAEGHRGIHGQNGKESGTWVNMHGTSPRILPLLLQYQLPNEEEGTATLHRRRQPHQKLDANGKESSWAATLISFRGL